jgi:toxin ParE1/3/4
VAELFVSRRAEAELREIWRTIAARNPTAADRLLLRFADKLDVLRRFPEIGIAREDIRPGFRMLIEGKYLLLYAYDDANDAVDLIAVVDGRRDLSALF